jgi:hypothetical protein
MVLVLCFSFASWWFCNNNFGCTILDTWGHALLHEPKHYSIKYFSLFSESVVWRLGVLQFLLTHISCLLILDSVYSYSSLYRLLVVYSENQHETPSVKVTGSSVQDMEYGHPPGRSSGERHPPSRRGEESHSGATVGATTGSTVVPEVSQIWQGAWQGG